MKSMGMLLLLLTCTGAWADSRPNCDPSRGQFFNILECRDYAGSLSNCNYDSFLECWVYSPPRPTPPGGTGCNPALHEFDDPWTCARYSQGEQCTFNIFTRCFTPNPVGTRCSSQASRYLTMEECQREERGRECYYDAGCYSPKPLPWPGR